MYKGAGHSTFVTGHSVLRHSQIFVTGKICRLISTANHIQYNTNSTRAGARSYYGRSRPCLRPVSAYVLEFNYQSVYGTVIIRLFAFLMVVTDGTVFLLMHVDFC